MRRTIGVLLLACAPLALTPEEVRAQEPDGGTWRNAAIGGGLGVAGGAVATLSIVVARAQLQEEYLDSAHDLIHWQTTPMLIGPAAGVLFGLAGEEVLIGSILGSLYGLVGGAAVGAGAGWMVSAQPESPWAGGVIGAGAGLMLGGLTGALLAWRGMDEGETTAIPATSIGLRIPL